MQKLSPSEARAEALFIVVRSLIEQTPDPVRLTISDDAHRAATDLGLYDVEQEVCDLLNCPPEHSLSREDDLLANRRR